jgi:hypothetical protein
MIPGAVAFGAALVLAGCGGVPEPEAESAGQAPAAAAAPAGCEPDGGLQYICGAVNAEDLLQVGDSRWVLASGMNRQEDPGHIYLFDHETKGLRELFPGDSPAMAHDTDMFGGCPGPIDTSNFSSHGLALREQEAGRYKLYMTSHGAREAIEIFDLDATQETPALTWVGCVILPERTSSNSVAILADGGFVTTKMVDPTLKDGFAAIIAGEISGLVYEWHPGGEVRALPGTELSGPNGIELSPDQRYMYVAALGSREIVRFDRQADPMTRESATLSVRPDNLRWTPEGKLYTAGGNYVNPADCAAPPCATGWSVIEIDPDTLEATRVVGADQNAALQGASTGLVVDDEIWIGTFRGDRVGYFSRP